MKKRVLSAFMALALCLTLLPTAAWAEEPEGTAQTPLTAEEPTPPASEEGTPPAADEPTPPAGEEPTPPDSEEPAQEDQQEQQEEALAAVSAQAATGHTHYLCGKTQCSGDGHNQ